MVQSKLIIEMRINEYTMRDGNPNVPWTPSEIAETALACREAGAAIVHFHGRAADGSPDHSFKTYREAVRLIRAESDVLIHPTLGDFRRSGGPEERLAHIVQLSEEGFAPDLAPLDMGTSNVDVFDAATRRFTTEDKVYVNTTGTLHYFADRLRGLGVKPYPIIWNIPTIRLTDAFYRAGWIEAPLFLGLGLSEGGMLATHPGTQKGLRAYIDCLPEDVRLEWSVTLFGASILPLASMIIAEGGHIAAGLGDYHYRELGTPTNADLCRRFVQMAHEAGREVATPEDARHILGMREPAYT